MKTHLFQVRFLLEKMEIYFGFVVDEDKILGEAVRSENLKNVDISAFKLGN
ncbi:MAG: hypothetical protein ABS960_14835 [Solibacillus isronensis]